MTVLPPLTCRLLTGEVLPPIDRHVHVARLDAESFVNVTASNVVMSCSKPKVKRVCQVCGKTFSVHPYRASAKWCSKACWSVRAGYGKCESCGATFKANANRRRFCSVACRAAAMVGAKSPHWRGGTSADRERASVGEKLRRWRIAVFARDGYACQTCGAKGRIHAHHVQPFATVPALRFDVANGQTLCESCHGKVHGKDFSNRRHKTCPVCRKRTTGRGMGGRCRRCATFAQWAARTNQTSLPLTPA